MLLRNYLASLGCARNNMAHVCSMGHLPTQIANNFRAQEVRAMKKQLQHLFACKPINWINKSSLFAKIRPSQRRQVFARSTKLLARA
jgi:hypothetical protein